MKKRVIITSSFIITALFLVLFCFGISANNSDYCNLVINTSEDGFNYCLTVSGNLSEDTYSVLYEDDNGALTDYEEICSFEITEETKGTIYNGLIVQNCAPLKATTIAVYNSTGERIGFTDVGILKANETGEKLYSFAAISDTHIGSKTSVDDLQTALTFFENDSDIKFTTVCGDLSLGGTEDNLNLYKSTVDAYATKPVYAISGNHETNATFAPLAMDSLQAYTGQDLYYSFTYNDDVYIMLGIYSLYDNLEFAEGELQWLYEILEENRNKRCFLFLHLFPRDGSGDAVDLDLEGDMLNNTQGQVFYSLLSHYSNIVYFHGHSHQKFELQEYNRMNTYDNIFGCHSIHVPSLAYPKHISEGKLISDYDASEGYVVDVYTNSIILKGRDFVSGKFLPIASYALNTEIKNVAENTYYDSTGTIKNENSNVLKSGNTWYAGTFDKKNITKISFVTEFASEIYDECWDASMSENGQVMAYRIGTEIFVVGNTKGIVANADSSYMFSDFQNLSQIVGLENIDMINVLSIDGLFKNCHKLTNVNLSVFKDNSFKQLNEVFMGCSSIEFVDISDWDLSNVTKYNFMFNDCALLEKVDLGQNPSSLHTNIYCSNMFKNCVSLENFDFSVFGNKSVYLGSIFYGCTNLTVIDFKDITPTGMAYSFTKCTNLESVVFSNKLTSVLKYCFDNCPNLKFVFFTGTEDEWNNITINNNNDALLSALIHYNAVGYTLSDWIVDYNPTCTLDGSKHKECTECGETLETEVIDALGHSHTSEITTPATHLATGVMTYTCHCGDTYTETIEKIAEHNHNLVVTAPTCTKQGYTTYTCECGDTYVADYVDALGHSHTSEITTPATHLVTGVMTYTCHCGDTYTETIEKIAEHNHNSVVTAPTCTKQGYTTYTCECGDTYVADYVDVLGHITSDWVVDVEPTCYTDGRKSKHCTRCNIQIDSAIIPSTNHIDKCYCYEYEVVSAIDKTIKITKYSGKEAKVEIPEIIDGYTVVAINKSAFSGNTAIISVEIPDTVKTIGQNAFSFCRNLAKVVLPDGLTTIEYSAFSYCTGLINIKIPDSVTGIGESAFSYCSSLETINIPSEITYIRKNTFRSCSKLTRIIVSDKVEIIDEYAFAYCSSLIDIWLPTSIDVLCENAFSYSSAFSTVYYAGAESEWNNITIGKNQLNHSVQIHYNVSVEEIDAHWQEYLIHATCIADGEYGYACHCGYKISTSTSALGHEFNEEFTIDKEPTFDELGSKSKHCTRCEAKTDITSIPMLVKNGWINENGKWAYYENNVKVTNKWLMDNIGWCYVGEDGYCVTNCWKADSVGWCYLDANGRMVINNWILDNGKWYFIDGNGYMASNCWKKDSIGWVYLGSSGAMLTNTWVKDSVGWCYVGEDGYCLTNQWAKDSKGWCYLDSNGRMVYNQWVKYNNNWYYVDANGYMVTGTKKIGGKTYKFNSNGVWIG